MAAQANFALAPGLVQHASIINYATREGQKLFELSTKPLKDDFNLDHPGLSGFLEQLGSRARTSGWNEILQIPPDLNDINTTIDLLTRYGSVTLEQVQAHAITYLHGNNRAAQDSMQMYLCILNSLTKTAQASIALLKHEYTLGDADPQVSGPCLLKVIIRKSHVDTNATTSHILNKLAHIDKIVRDSKSNITLVNERVQGLVDELAARGETTSHLLNDLFEGYKAASDSEFTNYIKHKQQEYNDGTTPIHAATLMYLATNFYLSAVENEAWDKPTAEEEQIIALETQIKLLEANATDISSASSKSSYSGNSRNVKPAWMTVPPAPNEPHKKVVNGKDYYWCPNHQAWVRHLPSKCEGKGIKQSQLNKSAPSSAAQSQDQAPQLKVSTALTALIEQDDEEEQG